MQVSQQQWGAIVIAPPHQPSCRAGPGLPDQCIELCHTAAQCGTLFLLECPDSSDFDRLQHLKDSAFAFAVQQSDFGATARNPTSFITNASPAGDQVYPGWPTFAADGSYTGPLPPDPSPSRTGPLVHTDAGAAIGTCTRRPCATFWLQSSSALTRGGHTFVSLVARPLQNQLHRRAG